jgi:sec-independent protein translocase protein TatB
MFDFAWSEIALIGVVALVAIGPKDMPVAIKAISDTIKKLRRMAGEFQGHVDEMLRDADLSEAKSTFDELRTLNIKGTVQRAIDPDSSLRAAFADPLRQAAVRGPVMTGLPKPPIPEAYVPVRSAPRIPAPPPPMPSGPAPAFIPPAEAQRTPAPAFIPPSAARKG